jgi:DNA-binding CsgD family transcriptional regulator
MDNKKNALVLADQQHKLELQMHRAELKNAETEKRIQILRRNTIIIGVILLAGLTILFINGRRKYYMQKSKLAEAEKQMAEEELSNAKVQLLDFTKSIHEKNELIEKIRLEVEENQSQLSNNNLIAKNEILIQLQQSILLTDVQWEQFKTNFEKVHAGFLSRLKEKLPDLTPAETRYLALAKLKLSNKEMAAMLGVSMQGVRNYRYRLRKKINLPEEGEIEDLINMV